MPSFRSDWRAKVDEITLLNTLHMLGCFKTKQKAQSSYCPSYPWHQNGKKLLATEEDAITLFQKYVSVLTDEEIDIRYQDVENGG